MASDQAIFIGIMSRLTSLTHSQKILVELWQRRDMYIGVVEIMMLIDTVIPCDCEGVLTLGHILVQDTSEFLKNTLDEGRCSRVKQPFGVDTFSVKFKKKEVNFHTIDSGEQKVETS